MEQKSDRSQPTRSTGSPSSKNKKSRLRSALSTISHITLFGCMCCCQLFFGYITAIRKNRTNFDLFDLLFPAVLQLLFPIAIQILRNQGQHAALPLLFTDPML